MCFPQLARHRQLLFPHKGYALVEFAQCSPGDRLSSHKDDPTINDFHHGSAPPPLSSVCPKSHHWQAWTLFRYPGFQRYLNQRTKQGAHQRWGVFLPGFRFERSSTAMDNGKMAIRSVGSFYSFYLTTVPEGAKKERF